VQGAADLDLPYRFAVLNDTVENKTVKQAIATLQLQTAQTVAPGIYTLTLMPVEAYNADKSALTAVGIGATITVSAAAVGDIDGDGSVALKDVMLLLCAVVNDQTVENGDLNGDNKISLVDVIRVMKLVTQ